jgi:hypothetical protein
MDGLDKAENEKSFNVLYFETPINPPRSGAVLVVYSPTKDIGGNRKPRRFDRQSGCGLGVL